MPLGSERGILSGMTNTAKLILDGKEMELPVTVGSEDEVGIDISKLRPQTGAITLDPSFANTGACEKRHYLHRRRAGDPPLSGL